MSTDLTALAGRTRRAARRCASLARPPFEDGRRSIRPRSKLPTSREPHTLSMQCTSRIADTWSCGREALRPSRVRGNSATVPPRSGGTGRRGCRGRVRSSIRPRTVWRLRFAYCALHGRPGTARRTVGRLRIPVRVYPYVRVVRVPVLARDRCRRDNSAELHAHSPSATARGIHILP